MARADPGETKETASTANFTKRSLQAAARREEILRTALRLFAAKGFAATTTKEIAQTVGVAEGLIFRYFPDKKALLLALAQQTEQTAAARAVARLDDSHHKPVRDVLTELAETWLSIRGEEADLTRVLTREAPINADIQEVVGEVLTRARDRLTIYLAARQVAGEVRKDLDARLLSHLVLAGLVPGSLPKQTKILDLVDTWMCWTLN